MLKIKDVYKVFNVNTINENRVFDGFSLQVEKGEYVSIIGSNGAGKSTLLNLITGNLPVDSGSIMIDGEEVVKMSLYRACISKSVCWSGSEYEYIRKYVTSR